MTARHKRSSRRGVLLLVVLGLLAMFGLVAVAFVVVAGQAQRAARTGQRMDQYLESPQQLTHQVAMQAFRGPNNAFSVMGPHSLLEKLYGLESTQGVIGNVAPNCGGQLFEFPAPGSNPYRYAGCVLTMVSGVAAGQSTRIVGVCPTEGRLQAVTFPSGIPANIDTYVINGAAYSGMGFGYNPATGRLDAANAIGPLALLPNALENRMPIGGANSDYTAVDIQNMLLGMVVYRPGGPPAIIPSLHRPELVRYWISRSGESNPELMRSIILRPLPIDHPNFTGSNPAFNPVTGPWDADNDGDGWPDSIWVDPGLPVRAAADGRLYKVLVAYLVVDLDGRLNVNAHGTLAQTMQQYYNATADTSEIPIPGVTFAGGINQAPLPRGQGFGPAEINLLPLFQDPTSGSLRYDMYQYVLIGAPQAGLDGRYGDLGGTPRPGFSGQLDPLSYNKWFEYAGRDNPAGYWGFFTAQQYPLDAYGSPPDPQGTGAVGLDPLGHPLFLDYWFRNGVPAFSLLDNPYELNLGQSAPRGLTPPPPGNLVPDNPYSVGELERILRPFDRDAPGLANRLFWLTYIPPQGNTPGYSLLMPKRHAVTTESSSVPCAVPAMPKLLRQALGDRPRHVSDLLLAKGVPQAVWPQLLPSELLAGLKLDINRPFGNGRDDDQQGQPGFRVVDDPDEVTSEGLVYASPSGTVGAKFDHFNNGNPNVSGPYTPQQIQARYLYVLMMLLADLPYLDSKLGGSREQTCRFLAQWAVNAVDFRDRDSIMTRFPYVVDPFTASGWTPDNNPLHIVYGCERPELLISEPIGFHDRKTEDLDTEKLDPAEPGDNSKQAAFTQNKVTDPAKDKDASFDQKKKPQGSLLIELYNPQSPLDLPPGEFYYNRTTGQWAGGVILNQKTPQGHPVWRLAICQAGGVQDELPDPDDPQASTRPTIERSVYFMDMSTPPPGFTTTLDGLRFYPEASLSTRIAPVMPGRYAVIGPGSDSGSSSGSAITYLGERSDKDLGKTRRIVLTPNASPDVMQVEVMDNKTTGGSDLPSGSIQPAAAVVINRPRRLNISEPKDGYPANDPNGQPYNETDGYPTPYDQPLDSEQQRTDLKDDPLMLEALRQNGTKTAVRIVHLQRLANPLQAYHEDTNPYRTIDSMAVDLTVFNGMSSERDPSVPNGDTMFQSRQRGERNDEPNQFNLWKQEPVVKPVKPDNQQIPDGGNHYFKLLLTHTFGYLNKDFGEPVPVPGSQWYHGRPNQPFPWLTWNNRPFVSPIELLLVPSLRSSKLLARNEKTPHTYYAFVKSSDPPPNPYNPTAPEHEPFPHLLNFFNSGLTGSTADGPQFFRLLDYVGVPSRFAGSEIQANPQTSVGGDHWFHPPFNRISTYREPGRMNLNTMFCEEEFYGLMNFFPGMSDAAAWAKFVQSRRGYGGQSADVMLTDPQFPTRFARPFRSFAGAELAPLDNLRPQREVDITLLRPDPADQSKPLFRYESKNPVDNADRNPYFRYEGLQRLSNLVTTQSNVYAVWITIGYFEVQPWPGGVDKQHPDGYALGQELGSDTGEIERHRAFYIFDRSIPVGFQRGQDLNVENAILLKRFIE